MTKRRRLITWIFFSTLLFWPGFALGDFTPILGEKIDTEYLKDVKAQKTHFWVRAEHGELICDRALMWFLEFQDEAWLDKLVGPDVFRSMLQGKCLNDSGFQFVLHGKNGKLAYRYLLTMTKKKSGILILLNPLGDGDAGELNARLIAYHLRTGQLREQFLEK
jgi:hypothetical protein